VAKQALPVPEELQPILAEVVHRIVQMADPDAIVLFGSHAQGRAREESDLDLLVVARTNNRWRLASKLYVLWHELRRSTPGLPPADILVYTPRQFVNALVVGFPAYEAARHGVILYGRLPERSTEVA